MVMDARDIDAVRNAPPITYLNNRIPADLPQYLPGHPNNVSPVMRPPTVQERFPTDVYITEPHHFASVTEVAIIASNTYYVKFLDQPVSKRNLLMLRNGSTTNDLIYIGFNSVPSPFATLTIQGGQLIIFDTVVPQDDLYVVASAASVVFSYAWSTYSPVI